jgi:hypothetical protein
MKNLKETGKNKHQGLSLFFNKIINGDSIKIPQASPNHQAPIVYRNAPANHKVTISQNNQFLN